MAESFGTDAERYDRTRPSYPDELVARIVAASPGRQILDVGCGTGIVARQFQAAGCSVLGVDPDARMADLARQRGLDVEVAKIEDWDPAGRQFDAVVAGQAWHWVEPVAGAATAAAALRRGGQLAVFWNVFAPPPDLAAAFAEVNRRVLPDMQFLHQPLRGADAYSSQADKAAGGIRATGSFAEPEEWRLAWQRPYTKAEWLDMVPTTAIATRLPPATLDELLADVGAAIDAAGGGFTMSYTTLTVTAVRT